MTSFLNYHVGAAYTVELGCLIENGFDIGLQHYPIFDETYREQLNRKIVEHFWFREIGAETPQLFKMFINRKMNEIMPLYNEVYKSDLALKDKSPFANHEIQTDGWRNTANHRPNGRLPREPQRAGRHGHDLGHDEHRTNGEQLHPANAAFRARGLRIISCGC